MLLSTRMTIPETCSGKLSQPGIGAGQDLGHELTQPDCSAVTSPSPRHRLGWEAEWDGVDLTEGLESL